MQRRGFGHGHKPMCPYCGGPHLAGECPMMMYPPAMPMPSVPMPPMGGMPMGGMPMGGMMGGMPGGMPMGGYPGMPTCPTPPMGGMMPGMEEHMAKVEKMLADIEQCCDQTCTMVKEIYMKMAKG